MPSAARGVPFAPLALAACAGFHAPDDAECARILAAAPAVPEAVSETCEVELASAGLRGTFQAVLASERGGRVRLQLFPDVGGKILDLYADSSRVLGVIPQAELRYDEPVREAAALPRHVLLFFALTLLERATPLARERLLEVRASARGLEARLRPRIPGCEVIAVLDDTGAVRERRYRYRGVAWSESVASPALVEGAGFRLEARVLETAALAGEERAQAFLRLP